jgi:hypothetical protein
MPSLRGSWSSSAFDRPAADARTTYREHAPACGPEHLRVVIARVLRTGRGPAALVGWVRRQLADQPPPAGDAAAHLVARLLARLGGPMDTVVG